MKKIFYFIRNGKGFSLHMDRGILKAILFFTLIFFLHDLVEQGENGFAVKTVEWLYKEIFDIGFILLAIYIAWKALDGEYPIKIKKEIER
jgi:hypothetical protein